ncbi:MAG: glutamine--fructose-6-phosphate transaminase (isomerizing) [Bacteroidales bacterium]|nr:glutamine--fructose-6-phosphate transaminase (isomerizing) [Bacteroidales bacterium]MCL2132891.1 glutamine--fructose-6-phosphate transaminase (isomerizing) [Bacteroidales bacterium]
MCGIIGYVGKRNAVPVLIEGLKRLEYRGYDSAGLAIITKQGNLLMEKKEGKIVELEQSINWRPSESESNIGISHTRWATHGEPTAINAHPHASSDNKIALVHNGIIENHKKLKEQLEAKGYNFISQTDTEVLVHLIDFFYKSSDKTEDDFYASIQQALKQVQGTYGIAVINQDHPNLIVSARKGSPIIVGIGNDEFLVTSDVGAIIAHTQKVIYLEDGEIVKITNNHYEITSINNEIKSPKITTIDWDISSVDKGGYEHFMLKEIFEQPISVANAFRGRLSDKYASSHLGGISVHKEVLNNVKKIQLIGCGTSWHAGLIGKYIIEYFARIPVEVEYASEYRYKNPIVPENTLVFTISQSGETADTLAALREAKAKGGMVFGITNIVGSTIARETDGGIYIHAGTEIGVASTKAFTSQVTVLFLLGLLLGRTRHLSPIDGIKHIEELRGLPDKIQYILDKNGEIREIAKFMINSTNALYLGRGFEFPVALEGALKLKEISYIHAEGYPAAEMKHGPIALIDENMPVVAICPNDFMYDKVISNLQEVKARKGKIIAIANEGDTIISALAEHVIYIPETLPALRPILSVIPLQLLAYHVADLKGINVDQPRNLAKSVTVE